MRWNQNFPLNTKHRTVEDKLQNVGQGKLQLIKYPSEEIQLRRFAFQEKHTHVCDLIFTLAHKGPHMKGGVFGIWMGYGGWIWGLLFSFFVLFVIVLATMATNFLGS